MKKLFQLLRENAAVGPRAAIEAKAEGDIATVYLYDVIDQTYGINAQDFSRTIAGLGGKTLNLRINSPGGDVFEARAIATALRAHQGKVVAYIDGLAASAATTIAAAASEVEIAPGSFYMIHNSWTLAMGDKNALRGTADLLEKVDGAIVADYMAKTCKPKDEIVSWMNAETWFTAEEAVANGFADRMSPEPKAKNSMRWNLNAFDNAPEALLAQPATEPEPDFAAQRALNERRLRLLQID